MTEDDAAERNSFYKDIRAVLSRYAKEKEEVEEKEPLLKLIDRGGRTSKLFLQIHSWFHVDGQVTSDQLYTQNKNRQWIKDYVRQLTSNNLITITYSNEHTDGSQKRGPRPPGKKEAPEFILKPTIDYWQLYKPYVIRAVNVMKKYFKNKSYRENA